MTRWSARALLGLSPWGVAALCAWLPAGAASAQGETSFDRAPTRSSVSIRGSHRYQIVPEFYVVRRGDTLWDLTNRYYGTPWEWPRVWSYNPEITNPHWIYPDDQIRLAPADYEQEQDGRAPRVRTAASVWLRDQGYLDPDALRTAGTILGAPEDHMMLSPSDEVYVGFAEGADVDPGEEMTVFREIPEVERELNGKGQLVRVYGTLRIHSYDAERRLARATVTEAIEPVERGQRVADVRRRFDLVDPVANEIDLNAEVVATVRPRELVGDNQVVFVNAGSDQGVRSGNRFFVVRSDDEWRDSLPMGEVGAGASDPDTARLEDYPDEIIAEARVVTVRPGSCTLMVTEARREILVGDRVELREGY